ncbi:MAG: EAL domain-containing protein [Pseudomonadota bacterium]
MKRIYSGVRARLIWLVMLAVIPALALIIYNGLEQRSNAYALAEKDALSFLQQISHDQNLTFLKAEQLLLALGKIPAINTFNVEACNSLLSSLISEYRSYISFAVFDTKGELICSGPPPKRQFNIADRPHFRAAMQTKRLATSGYVVSRMLDKPSLFIAQPMLGDDNEPFGLVNTGLDLRWLDDFLTRSSVPLGATLTLFDSDGIVLAHYPQDQGQVGATHPKKFLVDQAVGSNARGSMVLLEGDKRNLYVYQPLSDKSPNTYVSMSIPLDVILAPANHTLRRNLILLGMVALLIIAAAWAGGNFFVLRYLNALVTATRRLRQGDLAARTALPAGNTEFHELANDFDSMAHELELREHEQRRVEQALRKLAQGSRIDNHHLYLRSLVRHLADALHIDNCLIALLNDADGSALTSEIVYSRGKYIENFTFDITDTPCQDIFIEGLCMHEASAQASFPDGHPLSSMGMESCAACSLKNADGKPLGLLMLFDHKKLEHPVLVKSLLPVFASRVAIEIEHMRGEKERSRLFRELQIAATAFESNEGLFISDQEGRILRINKSFSDLTGYLPDEVKHQTPEMLMLASGDKSHFKRIWIAVQEVGHWKGEEIFIRRDGEHINVALSISAVRDKEGAIINYVFHFQDISARKEAESRIKHMVYHDALTNLPNRLLVMDRLKQAISLARRRDHFGVLMYLDLDHFKNINDSLGHSYGDRLLIEVTRRFQAVLREEDTIARLGGDEFVALVPQLSNSYAEAARDAQMIAEKLRDSLHKPFEVLDKTLRIGLSIGVAVFPEHGVTAEDLLKKADMAMYSAKNAGRNTVRFFKSELQEALVKRLRLEAELQTAKVQEQFVLYFQPQLDMKEQRVVGSEALLRWNHPTHGITMPDKFIPLLEDTGMITDVGQWVLLQACQRVVAMSNRIDPKDHPLRISVNVSPRQFHQQDFVQKVEQVLDLTGIAPELLDLEITEGIVIQDTEDAIEKMHALKRRGVNFSIDDFGTGYSSLSYIKRLPIDTLKIDRGFVRDCINDPNDRAIVLAIINMAKSLGFFIVAEGVETEQQVQFLQEHGCDFYQGYYFSKPVPEDEYLNLLARENRDKIKLLDSF